MFIFLWGNDQACCSFLIVNDKLFDLVHYEREPWHSGKAVALWVQVVEIASCKICRERLRTEAPSGSNPSPDPAQSGSFMHHAALLSCSTSWMDTLWWSEMFCSCSWRMDALHHIWLDTSCQQPVLWSPMIVYMILNVSYFRPISFVFLFIFQTKGRSTGHSINR
jgi:hypothetical protein